VQIFLFILVIAVGYFLWVLISIQPELRRPRRAARRQLSDCGTYQLQLTRRKLIPIRKRHTHV
jgi:hypothetical protein